MRGKRGAVQGFFDFATRCSTRAFSLATKCVSWHGVKRASANPPAGPLAGRRTETCRERCHSGRAKATYASPDRVPIFPPPAAITTYCRPPFSNVAGVA